MVVVRTEHQTTTNQVVRTHHTYAHKPTCPPGIQHQVLRLKTPRKTKKTMERLRGRHPQNYRDVPSPGHPDSCVPSPLPPPPPPPPPPRNAYRYKRKRKVKVSKLQELPCHCFYSKKCYSKVVCFGFLRAALTTKLSDTRQVSPDRVKGWHCRGHSGAWRCTVSVRTG